MLSYRHSFHAGNFADVLKHLIQIQILAYQTQKPKPLCYIDTHSGPGGYRLLDPQASKNREYENGIGALWTASAPPPAVAEYLAQVRQFNAGERLTRYPGSPWFAQQLLRPEDRLVLHELHPSEVPLLRETLARDSRCLVRQEDGFAGCIALLPPRERRGLIMIDPPYELKQDYEQALKTLRSAHRRFATGTYALWYPVVERARITTLERELRGSGIPRIQLYELGIRADQPGHGMTASGMIVINPPWSLTATLETTLPWLADRLGVDGQGHWRCVELAG